MFDSFIYAFNAVVPIFVVTAIGYLLKNKGFLNDAFVAVSDKLVFKVLLPCLLFTNVASIEADSISGNDLALVLFVALSAPVLTIILCLTVPLFLKDKAKGGAFIQGVFRSNMALLGIPFAENLFGTRGVALASMVMAGCVPIFNVLAVIVLCLFNPDKSQSSKTIRQRIKEIVVGIVKNPLIIAIVVALPFGLLGWNKYMPEFATKSIEYFAKASTTLALIAMGANFKFCEFKGRVALAGVATALKTVIVPLVCLLLTHFAFGFTGVHLGIVLIAFGTPTAVSSYIMAKNMNSDASLANQIVLMTTFACMFTIFLFSFTMKSMGLI